MDASTPTLSSLHCTSLGKSALRAATCAWAVSRSAPLGVEAVFLRKVARKLQNRQDAAKV
jgi:hypothetical protein